MQEWMEMSRQTRWWKRKVNKTSQRQTLTWNQCSSTCSSSVQSWYKEFEKMVQSKPKDTTNWHFRCCNIQLSSRTPPGVPRQAQRAIHQLRLNRLKHPHPCFYWTDYVSNLSSLWNWGEDSWIFTSLLSEVGSKMPTLLWWHHWYHRCVPWHIDTAWRAFRDDNDNIKSTIWHITVTQLSTYLWVTLNSSNLKTNCRHNIFYLLNVGYCVETRV